MKTVWFKDLEKDSYDELRGAFVASHFLRKRLKQILEEKIDSHFKAQQNRDNYKDANWAYEQADAMGYCRALNEVIKLMEDNKEEEVKRPRGRPRLVETKPKPLI